MKYTLKALVSFILIAPIFTEARGLSARRFSQEAYAQASARSHQDSIQDTIRTPEQVQQPLKNLSLSEIPDVGTMTELIRRFNFVRDTRFLATEDASFPRRLTWLYPDDGCYARAEMASQKLIDQQLTTPKKIFVFGNLTAQTTNAAEGYVHWWYHVAVIYRVGATAYVVDPALNPQKPMTLDSWNKAVGGESTPVKYAICSHDTFDPDADCFEPTQMSEAQAEAEQKGFLQDEWNRLLELHRDPTKELGDSPPWRLPAGATSPQQ